MFRSIKTIIMPSLQNQRLTSEANMTLAKPITLEELRRAIDKGPRHKAPGADGKILETNVIF
jgi:hypothetical protein